MSKLVSDEKSMINENQRFKHDNSQQREQVQEKDQVTKKTKQQISFQNDLANANPHTQQYIQVITDILKIRNQGYQQLGPIEKSYARQEIALYFHIDQGISPRNNQQKQSVRKIQQKQQEFKQNLQKKEGVEQTTLEGRLKSPLNAKADLQNSLFAHWKNTSDGKKWKDATQNWQDVDLQEMSVQAQKPLIDARTKQFRLQIAQEYLSNSQLIEAYLKANPQNKKVYSKYTMTLNPDYQKLYQKQQEEGEFKKSTKFIQNNDSQRIAVSGKMQTQTLKK